MLKKAISCSAPFGRGSVLSRAPAADPEMTERPAVHSKTTGGRAPQQPGRRQPGVVPWDNIDSRIPGGGAWEHPVENSGRGGRALENIDSKNTGRVAQRKRCFRVFQQPA